MSTLAFRRPTVRPIHPQTWTRPSGSLDFRVTQRFAVPDSFYGGSKQHNAIDLGNFRCGDAVVAMAPGVVRRVQDNATALGAKTNALGMVIDHGDGITSEYWHLNGYSVASGAKVATGQQIGIVGRTGLGDVCHLHVEVKRNGDRIDPEPLMFGTPLTIEEEDVNLPPRAVQLVQAVLGEGNRLRVSRDTTEGSLVTDKAIYVSVYAIADDPAAPYTLPKVGGGTLTGTTWAWVGAYGKTWECAAVLLRDFEVTGAGRSIIPAADCSAQDNALEAIATAASGARQAIEAVERLAAR